MASTLFSNGTCSLYNKFLTLCISSIPQFWLPVTAFLFTHCDNNLQWLVLWEISGVPWQLFYVDGKTRYFFHFLIAPFGKSLSFVFYNLFLHFSFFVIKHRRTKLVIKNINVAKKKTSLMLIQLPKLSLMIITIS